MKQLPQVLHQHLAFSVLSPALLGAFTNLNAGLNICCDLIGKLNFRESWNLFAIFKTSFANFFFYFFMNPQGIKLELIRCFLDELK